MSKRYQLLCAAFSVVLSTWIAGAEQKHHSEPVIAPLENKLEPVESRYCARAGESLEDRIDRLETALRMAKAELIVNRRKR